MNRHFPLHDSAVVTLNRHNSFVPTRMLPSALLFIWLGQGNVRQLESVLDIISLRP